MNSTLIPEVDGPRLASLEAMVGELMVKGESNTLGDLQRLCLEQGKRAGEASISARLRELSGKGFRHEKTHLYDGLWVYWWPEQVCAAWRAHRQQHGKG